MPHAIDETHNPGLESWIESANDPTTDFPIQNLPIVQWSDLSRIDSDGMVQRVGVAIGDSVVDLGEIGPTLLASIDDELADPDLGSYDAAHLLGDGKGARLRRRLSELLSAGCAELRDDAALRNAAVRPLAEINPELPCMVHDYTDFYASVHHATNVGSMFRPDNPLLPNYKWIPVGYHGRASSVVPSGTDVVRPNGQTSPAEDGGAPGFGPCKLLDYELEMGVIIGRGNELGKPIPIAQAEDHILGLCLLNDWSARDMQKWEYVPLGPFLAKNFATTVSPCIVTLEALAPFRSPRFARPAGDPQPLAHLDSDHDRDHGALDITLEVLIQSAEMKARSMSPKRLSIGGFKDMYWTIAQMVTHHASNGCNLQPGDLLGSGTVSGPTREARGCMLELTWDGDPFANPPVQAPTTSRTPIELPTGEQRKFLADGDEIIIKGWCERDGYRRIGFGECRGVIAPAVPI